MGNTVCGASVAIELSKEPMGKGTTSSVEAISFDELLTVPTSMKARTALGTFGKTETTIVDATTGATMYVAKTKICFNACSITVFDASGALICVAKGKRSVSTATFRVLRSSPAYVGQQSVDTWESKRKSQTGKTSTLLYAKDEPLFAFAEGKIRMGLGNASCEYSLVKKGEVVAPLYTAKKLRSFAFALRVESATDGTLLGKVAQTTIDPSKTASEASAGVDAVAFLLISSFVGAATGSGPPSTVGALAGAGVI